jgi:hypothetical protein
MVSFARIQKALYIPVLAMLILFEMYMLTAFLPKDWQHTINDRLIVPFDRESYEHSKITHPDLESEIEHALRENPRLRISGYIIFVALLLGNALLMKRLVDALKKKPYG